MLTPTSDGFGDCGGHMAAVTIIWLIITPPRGSRTTWTQWRGSQLYTILYMLNV